MMIEMEAVKRHAETTRLVPALDLFNMMATAGKDRAK